MGTGTLHSADVSEWSALLCYEWAVELVKNNHFDSLRHPVDGFWSVTGKELLEYRIEDFNHLVPGYGDFFYSEFQALLRQRKYITLENEMKADVWLYEDLYDERLFGDYYTSPQPEDTTSLIEENQPLNTYYAELSGDMCYSLENASTDLSDFKTKYRESDTSLQCDEMTSLQCKVDIVQNYDVEKVVDKQHIKSAPSTLFTSSEIYTPNCSHTDERELKYHEGMCSKEFSPLVVYSQLMCSTEKKIKSEYSITRRSLRSCNTQEKTADLKTSQAKVPSSLEQYLASPVLLQKIPTKTRKRDRGPKNWEFLVRLLVNESTNPSLVKWEDRSTFTFRIVKSHRVATLWGSRSPCKKNLTYENFARGLRYHYKTKSLHEVSGKKLVYRCGEKAIKFLNELESSVSILRT